METSISFLRLPAFERRGMRRRSCKADLRVWETLRIVSSLAHDLVITLQRLASGYAKW